MKYLSLETFTDFVCIGSECPYTCCGDWKITIDEETDRFYRDVEGEMGNRLRNCIHREDGDAWIVLEEDGSCPFLNEKGLCSIYINLGEEHLSNTCTVYPRSAFIQGDIRFALVSVSCPEVARFYLTHEDPLLIDFAEDDDTSDVDDNTDWELFNRAIRTFTAAVSIAQNRDYSVKERMALVVLLASGFQSCVDEDKDPEDIIGIYSNPDNFQVILDQTGIKTCDLVSKASFVSGVAFFFGSVDSLDEKMPELGEVVRYYSDPDNSAVDAAVWKRAFELSASSENEIWQENLLVYILFKYYMEGLSKKNFYEKLMNGIGPILNIFSCINAIYRIIHDKAPSIDYNIMLVARLSRMIEHSTLLGGKLKEFFHEQGYTDPGFVLRLIS